MGSRRALKQSAYHYVSLLPNAGFIKHSWTWHKQTPIMKRAKQSHPIADTRQCNTYSRLRHLDPSHVMAFADLVSNIWNSIDEKFWIQTKAWIYLIQTKALHMSCAISSHLILVCLFTATPGHPADYCPSAPPSTIPGCRSSTFSFS